MPRRIGILTGGGDAPGLNAVIRAVTKKLVRNGVRTWGIEDGYEGLLKGLGRELTHDDVSGIIARGGTLLGTANRGEGRDRPRDLMKTYRRWKLDGLVAIGGDGTLEIAHRLGRLGARIVGVPKTIDNDVAETQITFGFDTAVSVATGAVEALHTTADSHGRIMVVEVMGRTAGWIALYAGVGGGADVILLPELGYDMERLAAFVRDRHRTRRFTIVVVAEGAGSAAAIASELENRTGFESRVTVLGHLQRSGSPTPTDRILATRFGCAAAVLALKGRWGRMVAIKGGEMGDVALSKVAGKTRCVPKGHELIDVALSVGTCFGQ